MNTAVITEMETVSSLEGVNTGGVNNNDEPSDLKNVMDTIGDAEMQKERKDMSDQTQIPLEKDHSEASTQENSNNSKISVGEVGTSVNVSASLNDSKLNGSNINEEAKSGNDNTLSNEDSAPKTDIRNKFLTLLDSDSEDDDVVAPSRVHRPPVSEDFTSGMSISSEVQENVGKTSQSKKKKKMNVLDSDSEDESNNVSNNDDRNDAEDNAEAKKSQEIKKSFQTLLDLDSSEEEEDEVKEKEKEKRADINFQNLMNKNKKPKKAKERKGSVRSSKTKAMKEIHSETQRLIRESAVSLPYHRPKQRTLQEFLNRKKVVEELPRGPTTLAKLKMSSAIVSRALEKKEQEAESFYKLSDSEEETTQTNPVPDAREGTISAQPGPTSSEDISIEETQKLNKNNVQDARNKKEIIQQGTLELGVPRKLFTDNFEDQANNDEEILLDNDEECSGENNLQRDKVKEKQTRKAINAPRKLFHSGCESNMDYEVDNKESADGISEKDVTEHTVVALIHSVPGEIETVDQSAVKNNISSNENNSKNTESAAPSDEISNTCVNRSIEEKQSSQMDIFETPLTSNAERTKAQQEDVAPSENPNTVCEKIQSDISKETASDAGERVIGLPPDFDDDEPKVVKQKLLSKLPNIKPKLKGFPGTIIDLSQSDNQNTASNILLNRFFSKHTKVSKQPTADNHEVVVEHIEQTIEGPKTVKEVIQYNAPIPKINDAESTKPGIKLQRLREDLKLKMAQKRNEEWKQKEQEMKDVEEEFDEEEVILCGGKKIEEDEVEELSESGESEPEVDDIPMKENKRTKCKYVDDEAEVSEDEEDDDDEEMEADDGDGKVKRSKCKEDEDTDDEDEDMDEEDECEDDDDDCVGVTEQPKRLKRIIRAFEEDSNMSDAKETETDIGESEKTDVQRKEIDVDIFKTDDNALWTSDTENDLLVSQSNNVLTESNQTCKTPLIKANVLNFVSPITQLTALNTGSESTKKSAEGKTPYSFVGETMPDSVEKILAEKSARPSLVFDKRMNLQKKLFDEPSDMLNDEELMELCSGTFGTQKANMGLLASEENNTESQCTDMTPDMFSTDKSTGNFKSHDTQPPTTSDDLVPCTKEDEVRSTQKAASDDKPWTRTMIVSSSDEAEGPSDTTRSKKLKKRKVKKLDFSDEESDDEDEEEEAEEEADNEQYVDYDSEENEVVVAKGDIKKVAAKFFEKEAELSESEWGSEDEDERDLDKLEAEDGDDEEIDEDQMRDQIGKLRAKQVQDEDQRDVRMLKELLFDDGDLHTDGAGRERKFRWRNIDKLGDTDLPRFADDMDGWNDAPVDEDEEQWRKKRHERDKFLVEQRKSKQDDIENVLAGNELVKVALKTVSPNQNQNQNWDSLLSGSKKDGSKVPLTLTDLWNKAVSGKSLIRRDVVERFSLLSHDEKSLARLALIAQQDDDFIENVIPQFTDTSASANENKGGDDEAEDTEQNDEIGTSKKRRKRKVAAGGTSSISKKSKFNVFFEAANKLL